MIVLKPTTDEQIFYIITRETSIDAETILTDDITGEDYTGVGVYELYGDYLKCSLEFVGLLENTFYTLRIKDTNTSEVIYKDKVFVTNQVINQINQDKYTINKDVYKPQQTSNNDYIVI